MLLTFLLKERRNQKRGNGDRNRKQDEVKDRAFDFFTEILKNQTNWTSEAHKGSILLSAIKDTDSTGSLLPHFLSDNDQLNSLKKKNRSERSLRDAIWPSTKGYSSR